jgi:hypothetical protein
MLTLEADVKMLEDQLRLGGSHGGSVTSEDA